MKKPPKTRGGPHLPIVGKPAHNGLFQCAIGGLVISWSNNESVFIEMLRQLITGGKFSAQIVWHSQRTAVARLELVSRLCRERVSDKLLIDDITKAISTFKGFTKTRNFYCHALYQYDSEAYLVRATSTTMASDDEPIRFDERRMDAAMANELGDATLRMAEFNRELWKLVVRLQQSLGNPPLTLPELLRETISSPDDRPHSDEDGSHEAQPPKSEE